MTTFRPIVDRAFYARPAAFVARDLLGMILVSNVGDMLSAGMIVETEAYFGPDDDASHASRRIGRTPRNEAMFGRPGTAYVYRSYGIHWCMNAVADEEDHPSGVLIRAAIPVEGLPVIRSRRPGRTDRELMRGPGKLCQALGITGVLDKHPLDREPLVIAAGEPVPDRRVATGPRIGITRAADLPLRFWVRRSPYVSARA